MATTTNLGLELLEVGQSAKEADINDNSQTLDTKVPVMLADSASDPTTTGRAPGTFYFNTSSNKLKVLKKDLSGWHVLNPIGPEFLGDAAADPGTTGVSLGSTYFNTSTSKLKVLRASGWANVA